MILYILRGAFLVAAASVTALYLIAFQKDQGIEFTTFTIMMGITISAALAVIAVDVFTRQKKLAALSGVFLGLVFWADAAGVFIGLGVFLLFRRVPNVRVPR